MTAYPRRLPPTVVTAVVMLAAAALAMLVLYRPLVAPDERYQLDRILAAADGQGVVLDPNGLRVSVRGSDAIRLVPTYQSGPSSLSIADVAPVPRADRPEWGELGSTRRTSTADVNYLGNHPPAYYLAMGAVLRLLPGAAAMPADQLVFWLRAVDVLLLLPVPVLAWATARRLGLPPPVAEAAALLPLLVPALVRGAATLNNDNLVVLLGTLLLYGVVRVMRGDVGVGTAAWLGAACVVGALTKGTFVLLLPTVMVAYATTVVRRRRLPPPGTVAVLLLAAAGSAAWYVRNLVVLGAVQPAATLGRPWLAATAHPRTDATPYRAGAFWEVVWQYLPGRYWGGLGLLEPPSLWRWVVLTLTAVAVTGYAVSVTRARGIRWELTVLWLTAVGILAAVVLTAMAHNRHFLAIPGLQGRYALPAVVGLLLPVVVALGAVLPRHQRWVAPLVALAGVALQVGAQVTVAGYYWVGTGAHLTPGTVAVAGRRLAAFAPFPPLVTGALATTALLGLLAGLGVVVAGSVPGSVAGRPVGGATAARARSAP